MTDRSNAMAIGQHSRDKTGLLSRDGGEKISTKTPGNANVITQGRLVAGRFPLDETPCPRHPFEPLQVDDLVLNFRVSLFVFPPEVQNDFPSSLQLLRKQVGGLRKLLHPLLLNILTEGDETGSFFFSAEQPSGESLSRVLRRRRANHQAFSLEEVSGLCLLLCRALDYLNPSVPHGFLNSEEIFLDPWPDGPLPYYPRIALPGIRFSFRHTPMAFQGLDREASSFAPPEFTAQEPLKETADVYGMGAVLYSLLTLRPPTGRFIRPSNVRPGLPEDVDRIVLRALEEDPKDRVASPHELAERLRVQPQFAIRWDELETAERRLVDGFRIKGVVLPASHPEEMEEEELAPALPGPAFQQRTSPAPVQRSWRSSCLLVLVFCNLVLFAVALWEFSLVKQEGGERLEEFQRWERFFLEKG